MATMFPLFLRFQSKQHHAVEFGHQVTRKLWMQKVHGESNSIWNSIDYANSHRAEGTAGLEWERSWISIPFIIWNQGSRCDFNYTRGVSDSLSLLANIIYAGDGSSLISAFSSDSALLAGFRLTKPFINILSVPCSCLFIYLLPFWGIWSTLHTKSQHVPVCSVLNLWKAQLRRSLFCFFGGQPFPTANNYSFNKNPLKSEVTYINF